MDPSTRPYRTKSTHPSTPPHSPLHSPIHSLIYSPSTFTTPLEEASVARAARASASGDPRLQADCPLTIPRTISFTHNLLHTPSPSHTTYPLHTPHCIHPSPPRHVLLAPSAPQAEASTSKLTAHPQPHSLTTPFTHPPSIPFIHLLLYIQPHYYIPPAGGGLRGARGAGHI